MCAVTAVLSQCQSLSHPWPLHPSRQHLHLHHILPRLLGPSPGLSRPLFKTLEAPRLEHSIPSSIINKVAAGPPTTAPHLSTFLAWSLVTRSWLRSLSIRFLGGFGTSCPAFLSPR